MLEFKIMKSARRIKQAAPALTATAFAVGLFMQGAQAAAAATGEGAYDLDISAGYSSLQGNGHTWTVTNFKNIHVHDYSVRKTTGNDSVLLFPFEGKQDRSFTFDGVNKIELATSMNAGASQGMNFGQGKNGVGDLFIDIASGETSISFPDREPGDTGFLVNRKNSGTDGLYQGDVTIQVREGARLDVNNRTSLVTKNPVSDAIEVEVQDRGTGVGWAPGQPGSQGASNIQIDFKGAADIVTSNGAGFYLAQGGTGNITVNLSKDVSITTSGESNPGSDSLNNHGINAVVASGGTGTIDIDSAAGISVTGGSTSAIFAFGDSADIHVKTRGAEEAGDVSAQMITVAGSGGSGIRTSASNGNTVIENGERIKVTGEKACGIHAEVAELSKLTKVKDGRYYVLNYQTGTTSGNSTGTIKVQNTAELQVDGRGATGILAERSKKAEGFGPGIIDIVSKVPVLGISVENTGKLRLDSTGTTGVMAADSIGDSVSITNAGDVLMYDRNESSTGAESPDAPRADDYATTGSTGLSAEAQGKGDVFVSNSGSMAIYGLKEGNSANAGIRATSGFGAVTVENSGRLYLTGVGNVAIDASSLSGDVNVSSTGILELDGTGRSARPSGDDAETAPTGTCWGIRAKTGGSGNVTVISRAPESFAAGVGERETEDQPSLSITHNHGTGIEAETNDGSVHVINSKDMLLSGDDNTGIRAVTKTGSLTVENSGRIRVKGRSSRGIDAESTGDDAAGLVSVTSHGRITLEENDSAAASDAPASEEKPIGILATSKAAAIQVVSRKPADTAPGVHSLEIRAVGGHGILARSESGDVSVDNAKEILLTREGSAGIEAWSKTGNVTLTHEGGIDAEGENGEAGEVGVFAHSGEGFSKVTLLGSVGTAERSADLRWGVMASSRIGETEDYGAGRSEVLVTGDIYADGKDSYGVGLMSMGGNVFTANAAGDGVQRIAGRQGIYMESYDTASNTIDLSAGTTLAPASGRAIVLKTRASASGASTLSGSSSVTDAEAGTLITNNGTIIGLIAQDDSGENALKTRIVNNGLWYLSAGTDAIASPANGSEFRLATVLGTNADNSVVNAGSMMLDPRFAAHREAVTWEKAGVGVFENSGLIDTSTNARAGDWLVITGSTDPEKTHAALKRAGSDISSAAYHHLPATASDPNLKGEFRPAGGVFRFDINLGSDQTGYSDVLVVDNVVMEPGAKPVTIAFMNRREALPADEVPLEKGIEVVRVMGTRSDEGAFVLGTPLVIDGYQYFLERDDEDHDWYVRNWRQKEGPDVKHVDPAVANTLALSRTAAELFTMSLLDRRDATWNPQGTGWVRIERNDGSFDLFSGSQKIDRKTNLLQAGATLWRSDDGLKNAGVFGGAGDAKVKARSLATGLTTSSRLDGWHAGAYWTSLSNWEGEGSGPYADLWAYWAQFRNKLSAAKWSTSGWAASAEFGWSAKPNGAPFVIEPHVQAVWSRLHSKGFEREGEVFTGGRFSGLSTRAGVKIGRAHV